MNRRTSADLDSCFHDEVVDSYWTLIGDLHDVTLHYEEDAGCVIASPDSSEAAAQVMHLAQRVQVVAEKTVADLRAAKARRNWEGSGRPMRCGSCGFDINRQLDLWRVCDGWAEHEECHEEDSALEAGWRACIVQADRWEACLDDRDLVGPGPGDLVEFEYADGRTEVGTWTLENGEPSICLGDGSFRPFGAGVGRKVLRLAGDVS